MIIRTVAILLAFSVVAVAQAPTPPPPKPRVISKPKTVAPKPKPKPKPKPAADPAELKELPPAAEPATDPAKPVARTPVAPAPEPKRDRAAEASLTAFMPKVKATLGKDWAASVQKGAKEFQPGNVSVNFKLDAEGKVTAVAITENSSNAAFGKFCEEYVRGLQFDPPPTRTLLDGALEIPFTFWLY